MLSWIIVILELEDRGKTLKAMDSKSEAIFEINQNNQIVRLAGEISLINGYPCKLDRSTYIWYLTQQTTDQRNPARFVIA